MGSPRKEGIVRLEVDKSILFNHSLDKLSLNWWNFLDKSKFEQLLSIFFTFYLHVFIIFSLILITSLRGNNLLFTVTSNTTFVCYITSFDCSQAILKMAFPSTHPPTQEHNYFKTFLDWAFQSQKWVFLKIYHPATYHQKNQTIKMILERSAPSRIWAGHLSTRLMDAVLIG